MRGKRPAIGCDAEDEDFCPVHAPTARMSEVGR